MMQPFLAFFFCFTLSTVSLYSQVAKSALSALPDKNGLTIMRQAQETAGEFANRIFSEQEQLDSAKEYLWNDEALGKKIILFVRFEDYKIQSVILEHVDKNLYRINTLNIGECGDYPLRIVHFFFDDLNNDHKKEMLVVYACNMSDTFIHIDENGEKETLPVHREFYYATIVHKIKNDHKESYQKLKDLEFTDLKGEEFSNYTAKEIETYVKNFYMKSSKQ